MIRIGDTIWLCLWLLALVGVCALCVVMLLWGERVVANPPEDYEAWLMPGEPAGVPPFYDARYLLLVRAITGLGVAITAFAIIANLRTIVQRRGNAIVLTSLCLALPLGFFPLPVRLLLPWEDPWTGAGSPIIVCMYVPIYALLVGIPIMIWGMFFIRQLRPQAQVLGGTDAHESPITGVLLDQI